MRSLYTVYTNRIWSRSCDLSHSKHTYKCHLLLTCENVRQNLQEATT